MRRRIIKQGHSTLTLTLPSKWTKKFNLKAGDEVDVSEQEKGILVTTENGPNNKSITIDISGLSQTVIWRYILSAYRSGYDEITITGIGKSKKNIDTFSHKSTLDYITEKNRSMISPTDFIIFSTSSTIRPSFREDMSPLEVVTACVNRLINIEIIEQKDSYCIIKELGETTYKEFDNALRRIFLLLKFECEHITEAIKGNKDQIQHIHLIDTNLDRFEDFCLRVLNKRGYVHYEKTPAVYSTIFLLEMIGDELKKIGLHLRHAKKINEKIVSELFEVQSKQISRFYELFYNFDKKRIEEIYNEDRKGSFTIEKYYKKLSDDEKELLHHFKKIGILILNLTELRIDMEI